MISLALNLGVVWVHSASLSVQFLLLCLYRKQSMFVNVVLLTNAMVSVGAATSAFCKITQAGSSADDPSNTPVSISHQFLFQTNSAN
jgi:hypothetical protein